MPLLAVLQVETSLEGPSFDVSGVVCSPGHWGTAVVVRP